MSALQGIQRIYGQGVQLRDELFEVLEFGIQVIGFVIVLFLLLEIKQAFFNQPKQPHGGVRYEGRAAIATRATGEKRCAQSKVTVKA